MGPSKFTFIDARKISIVSLLLNLFFVHLFPAVAQDGKINQFSVSNQFLNTSSHSEFQTASYSPKSDFLPTYFDKTPLSPSNLIKPVFQSDGESEVNWTTFSVITGGVLASYTGLFLHIKDRWWDEPRVSFHFSEEFYADGFDKFGHFYASKTQALAITRLYQVSGLSHNKSILLGAGITLSVQTMIEMMDGRTNAGFDRYDQLGNIAGIGWFYAREKSDFLQRFNIRWMYYPSETRHRQLAYRHKRLSDYNGQSYWVSMRFWDLLPSTLQPYWPRFLVPTAGVSMNDWPSTVERPAYHSFHLSLNLDFKHILPQESAFGRLLTDLFNGIHLPAPALELYPDPTFKLIFRGQD